MSAATIQNNKRNLKLIRNILKLLAVVIIGGTPYFLSIIINRISQTSRLLYSISFLCMVCSALVESAIIFFANDDIKKILSTKICCYSHCQRRQREIVPTPMGIGFTYRLNKNREPIIAQI